MAEFALLRGADQWQRCSFESAALVDGIVQLEWQQPASSVEPPEAPARGAGLAFDQHCRLYHSLPDAGTVERIVWAAEDPLDLSREPAPALQMFERGPLPIAGDFSSGGDEAQPLDAPRGLAVDCDDRLFIAQAGGRSVLVYDLFERRLLRRVPLGGAPLDLACDGRAVCALLDEPPGLVRLAARARPRLLKLATAATEPRRIACTSAGQLLVLDRAGGAQARVLDALSGALLLECPHASDIELYVPRAGEDPALVIARRPGEDFLRVRLTDAEPGELEPLAARGYDGLGIVRTPDERIAYWTEHGLRYAVAARVRYSQRGQVIGFRLDSGEYQTRWGRLFVDACIPRDTTVKLRFVSSDESPDDGLVARQPPPAKFPGLRIAHDELSPPMPAQWMTDAAGGPYDLYRRWTGPEAPWLRRAADDPFETYEAPVHAEPGRYLWVMLELAGNTRSTPRIRALRAEYPGHDYLRRIPRTLSSEPQAGSFLQRYLAPLAGAIAGLDRKALLRHVLLDPDATPEEVLPWLAGFLGLVLDERWSMHARRQAVREAVWLFRFRGTVRGLLHFIRIVTGVNPIIIEKFRLRGGGVVGEPVAHSSRAVLGGGMRVGGAVGESQDTPLASAAADGFETHAHRFVVLLPALLTEEQVRVVADLLDVHRPAHTLYELCTVGAGMRVGRGLHVGLSSMIGRGSAFASLVLGSSVLGRGAVIGRPRAGMRVGASPLPDIGDGVPRGDTRVG